MCARVCVCYVCCAMCVCVCVCVCVLCDGGMRYKRLKRNRHVNIHSREDTNKSWIPVSHAFSVQSGQNYQFHSSWISKIVAVNFWIHFFSTYHITIGRSTSIIS